MLESCTLAEIVRIQIDLTLFCGLVCLSLFNFLFQTGMFHSKRGPNESINQSIWNHQMLYTLVEGEGHKTIEMHPYPNRYCNYIVSFGFVYCFVHSYRGNLENRPIN